MEYKSIRMLSKIFGDIRVKQTARMFRDEKVFPELTETDRQDEVVRA